jgi:hypothetical protein
MISYNYLRLGSDIPTNNYSAAAILMEHLFVMITFLGSA